MKQFEQYLGVILREARIPLRTLGIDECQSLKHERCRVCYASALNYEDEVRLKNVALQRFWNDHFHDPPLDSLFPSPRGRGYRIVTKRKAFGRGATLALGLLDPSGEGLPKPFGVARCAIEPEQHAEIYRSVERLLAKPYAGPLAASLQYVVIKGNENEFAVILNVRELSREVVKTANTLSKSLTHSVRSISGTFLYRGEQDGRYYLGSKSPDQPGRLRKLYGKGEIYQKVLGKSLLHSPLSFTQVNLSLVEQLVNYAGELLGLGEDIHLFDLYCGYGLFSLCLAHKVQAATGVEVSPPSVASARENARRNRITNARFVRSAITADSLPRVLLNISEDDVVLLDPPRSGTAPGVIEFLASRHPRRVLHLFCDIDLMPSEINRWFSVGFRIERAVPFDMFPGTATIETLVLFVPT